MRLLLLQNAPWVPALGGANKHNRRLLEALAGRGHACAAVAVASREAREGGAPPVESFHLAGVDVEAVTDAARLREHADRRIRSFGPDWILVASEDPAQTLLEAALAARPGRVLYLARTTLGLPFGPQGFLPSARRTALLRKTVAVLAASRYLQGYIRQWTGIESVVLPLHDYAAPRCFGRFDSGCVTLVNPCAVKGISLFLELARRLPGTAFAAVPTWGTTAEDRAALEGLANVRILPPSEDIETIFAETRILLVPSLWGEAFGVVSIEAMLRGIPVLASDVGGLSEAKLGVDYLLPVRPIESYRETLDSLGLPVPEVPDQDVTPWEEALRTLTADRGTWERLSRESRQAAQEFAAAEDFAKVDAFLQGLTPGEQPEARSQRRPSPAEGGRRKILLVQPLAWQFTPGGAHRTNRLLMEGLAARGHSCRAVAPSSEPGGIAGHEELLARLAELQVPILERSATAATFRSAGVEVRSVVDGRALWSELLREIRRDTPDWVVVSEDPTGGLLEAALKEAPGHVVAFAHSPSTLPFGPGSFERNAHYAELLRQTAGILTVSRWMAGYIRQWGGIEAHTVYSPAYGPGPFRRLGNWDDGFVTFVNPSGIKGLPVFLEMARRLPEVRFAAVPTWGTAEADRAQLAELPNVTILQPFENVDELFARTRVLLAPSLWPEAFGQIVVEAMLRGVPVLASDSGGLPEAKLGVDHILPVRPIEGYEERRDERRIPIPRIPPQDAGPWVDALSALLADRACWERLAEESFQAANAFVAGLGLEPYERFFAGLAPRVEEPAASEPPSKPDTAVRSKLDQISPEKLELLKRRLADRQKGGGSAPAALSIPRQPRSAGEDTFPLSFTQLRMWFLDQLEPGKAHYNESFGVCLRGRLDVAALAASLAAIVRRHESLRTRFTAVEGDPVQVVSPAGAEAAGLPRVDLRGLPGDLRSREAERLARAVRQRPFDLSRGPLLRMVLVSLAPEEHHLLIAVHHITADMWAIVVLMGELSALYSAVRAGRPSPLPALPIQYADFAVWQRQWLSGERLDGLLAWWRERLDGMPQVLDLPGDRPRSAVQSFRGATLPAVLPAPLAAALAEIARQSGATLFMVLLAGFQALLHRWTGQDDLAVGSPTAHRGRRELEGLIGCFINTLVLRGDLSGRPTGWTLLSRSREAALGAFAHQDLPFELLVEHLQPERSLSHGPLFQVMFMLQNTPVRVIALPEVDAEPLPAPPGVAKLDLMLSLAEAADGTIHGTLEFSRDLFDTPTAARLLAHLRQLLEGLTADPGRGIGELPLLSAAERHQLLCEWNDLPSREEPEDAGESRGLHEIVAAQARRTPEAPAVAFAGDDLTYTELRARASALAARLRGLGCGPETRVAVALERSHAMPVALLGVLESGAAYVPLDPAYPRDRLALVMEDAAPRVLITEERLLPALPPAPGAVLFLDREPPAGPREAGAAPPFDDRQLAYVLYTSGSTGRPKGVAVPHRALVRFLGAMRRAPGFLPGQRLLAVTSLAFDIAALEIFLPLTSGGCVELASREEAFDGRRLAARLRASGATVMQATPPTWRMLLDAEWSGDPGLTVLCGGEALPRDLAAALAGRARELWNLYGPTETTVWSAAARIHPDETGPVSIGPPIAGTRILLLDREMQPVPLGVHGELCIGGAGLARGYLNRPDLTAERFVPDPAGEEPGGRLYRTGDLARHLPGGRMEVLGRLDQQVKVRGFRIELGEIEAALTRHPALREAVVTLRDGVLVAYLVPSGETVPAPAELRDLLRALLPEPMVPGVFVPLAALPLTPNRKVDRRALPAPGPADTATAGFAPPRNPVEEVLAGFWADVLGREKVGIHDNFFDLGGHSLLATRVVSRLRSVFGVELPLRALFERPTVAQLAAEVEAARSGGLPPEAPPLVPVPRRGDLPLSFAQERLWFLDRLQPESPFYSLPLVLDLRGDLSLPALAASLGTIVARHEALRTTFSQAAGRPVQVIAPAVRFSLPHVDLEGLPEALRTAEALRLTRAEALRPFELSRGPLLRATVLRLEPRHHTALFNLHHIVADGWSLGVLVAELTALYGALVAGEPPSLPHLPVQYADYAVWQRGWLAGEVLESRIRWWQERLAGAPHVLDLPTDRPRPAVRSLRGAHRGFTLPAALSTALRELSRQQGATLFMTLASLLAALLSRHTGADDLLLGAPVAGRDRAETEGLIGLFVNTLVLRAELADDPELATLLGRMREMTLGAYAHQDLPFEKLVDSLQTERNLARTPLFQVLLTLQNAPLGTLELPGLAAAPAAVESGTTRFDLLLTFTETREGLSGVLEHNLDLFDPSTLSRLLGHLRNLAEGAVRRPDARISELPLLSAPEAHQIRSEWNDTAVPRPAGLLLHELFAARVAMAPYAPALVAEGSTLTYTELDRLTDRLAHRLRGLGVGPDVAVGVLMERSVEMVVALLGILKAGGGYLPLDPEHPAERLAGMVEDARVPVLLAQERLLPVLPKVGAQIVLLEAGWDGSEDSSGTDGGADALPRISDQSLAYVLYTSGSTGRPKGVMIPHRGIVNRLLWMQEAYGLSPDDRVLQKTPYSFDVSVWEFFWPLITGARLVIARPGGHRDPAYLAGLMASERVTVTHFVPSMLQVFLAQSDLPGCADLRLVVASGEALSPELRSRFRKRLPARLENLYGPTEASVDVTAWNCAEAARSGAVPIGRPGANTGIHLLDRSFLPLPIGVAGELCIGGVQLARGYLKRPDLTAERFVPDPCGGAAGERLYRTGDLARHLPDGAIEFLGRIDHQVKIRGFRIEPGEIEAALEKHPGVHQAVVVARPARGTAELVAFLVPRTAAEPGAASLREHLRQSLPDYMLPAAFVCLPELPHTTSRKVDRQALLRLEIGPRDQGQGEGAAAPRGRLEEELAALWREVLGVERVGVHDNFFEAGGHSLRLVEVQAGLHRLLGREVPMVDLFRYPTIATLAAFLKGLQGGPEDGPAIAASGSGTDIAIIGLEGRFPGAPDLERFWRNLRDGVESIVPLSDEQLRAAGLDPAGLEPDFVRAEPLLAGIDLFDAEFFGLSPGEAKILDPQHRLFLEQAWACLEGAGYDAARFAGRIGVFAGVGMGTYALNLFAHPELLRSLDLLSLQMAIDKDFLATRVSYKLGLRGPSFAVQAGCSTSLVAVHVARQSLLLGECDMALAGGVTLKIRQGSGYRYQEGAIASPDGHCRAFDANARGTVFGSGSGVVLLKRLDDALRDGDTIRAVLKGSAINNDGSLKMGFTAPSVDGQAEVIAAAHQAAGVSPESITYVEAHGTGTPLGDPVEVAALSQAFRRGTDRTGFCALGSLKTNVGHLDAAAGIAGLIKTVLALEHRQIPPSLWFEAPNPQIDFAASPFYVNTRLADWTAADGPRRAGVSAFGIGGTNAHAVLEEAPPAEPSGASRPHQLLLLSARTAGALEEATAHLTAWLESRPELPLADVAHTLRVGRRPFEHRRMLVCESREDALAALRSHDPERVLSGRRRESGSPPTAWLLPGQGSQYPGMGRDLYATEPVFRREIDACGAILSPRLGRGLREILFSSSAAELAATRWAQPALFAVEHALARLWLSWGLRPQALIGHSLGEYVAACLAGVLSLEDALTLVALRGELMQELPPGAMLSVDLPEDEALAEIAEAPGLSLAAVNGPGQCVVSGPAEEIDALAERLARRSSPCRRLHTSHAFHSRMMEPILGRFAEAVSRVELRPPSIPCLSNLTGTWITAAEATAPWYWVRHLREPVRFGDGISTLLADLLPEAVLLEVGPGRTLGRLVRGRAAGRTVLASMPHPDSPESGTAALLHAVGRLWLAGVEIEWPAFQGEERRRRVPLPTYPFQRLRHWVEPGRAGLAGGEAPVALLLPEGAADDPAWTAALESRGFRVVAVPPDQARPEALDGLLAPEHPRSQEPAPAGDSAGSAPDRPGISTPYAAPGTEIEWRLAAIWGDLLGIGRVGVHDDFFELGGHSLLATRLLSRLREAFGQEIPLTTVFAEPTIARLAARLQTGQPGAPERPAIERVPRSAPLPLSFAQQRLWFIDQLEPGSPLYNIAVALRAEGRLLPGVLALTLGEIVRRHEALRTVFVTRDGAPAQVIRPAAPFLLPVVDLSGLPESRSERLALDLAGEEAGRPFDLARDPLLRGLLLRQTPEDHTWLLTVHHIASDGWSLGILVREVAALYAAFAAGRPSPLPELPVQYADFAVWQSAWMQGGILEREISFWRSQLAGLPSLLELPTDRPRPAVQSFRGATRPVRLAAGLTRQAQALARREGATLFMVLLAGFQALLARYSGQQDLAVGSPVAGRHRLEIEDLIGFFVNTLVLRSHLSGEPLFLEVLDRTRETALAAHLHQDVPFEKLVQELAPERSLAHTPLFQVMFVLQNAPLESLEIENLRLRPAGGAGAMARFDLTLGFEESQGDLAGTVEYATDLFDATTIDRLILHYERLLTGIVEGPERRLGELDLLTAEEALQLRAWNETTTAWPLDRPLHAWIEEQVDRTPLAVAVTCEGEELSYRELDRRADRLARRLRSLGVGPEARVAICLERSAELVVALLAVLKAGGAYVPLDPEYPRERLAFMLADARPAALLSSEPLRDRLPEPEAPVVWLDREAAAPDTGSGSRLPGGEATALQLAYMIYTSGSTGLPKGVQVPHRALVNFLFALRDLLAIGPGDRLLAVTSLSFDIAALELYLPLLVGATVEVVRRETAVDGDRLRERLEASGAAFLQATPSTWRMLVRAGWQGSPGLTVLCGGEALPEDLARDLTARAPAVWNLYGPTETTVWSSAARLSAAAPAPSPALEPKPPRVTLGRPIANTEIHLLDRHFQPVPVGVPGELYIGGDGVTRGYLRRPDLTAERFLPDPFATDRPGLRLYRTGDLTRRRPDGRVEFLGRVDHQVKLRGFRIEPGEIEAALAALSGVREAVVVVREDRLVAYVAGTAAPEELRLSLRERLPDYMVPAAFVTLAALPLTPNGKIDRKALPAPEWQGAAESHVEPRTPAEEVLAGIWAELLGLERVGATDHFFDRGGHSLLATQVMSRLRAAFGVELPLRTLFEAPVLESLAARIEEARRTGSGLAAPPLVPVPRQGPLPLSFAQQRLWFIDQLEPGSPLYNIAVALRIEGPLDRRVLELCLGEVLRRHEALRTVFAAPEGAPVQVIQPAAPCVLPLVDLSGLPASRREAPALAAAGDEAARPFDLTRGPLLRGVLARMDAEGHVLALTLHHIASDGWSLGILVREVAALYAAFAEGRPSPLPELPVQYADFAVWQASWLQGERLENEISFWRRQLAGLPPLLELPTDRPRPAMQSFRGASWPVRLPARLAREAQTLSRREGATLFMVLLAAFQTLLARYSGQRALAVGSPVAGRNRLETEDVIGFFVNTLVLPGDLAGEPSFRELLGRTRETALAAYLHQDLPFEKMIEELAPERSLAHSPLFQVMLALQNPPDEILEVRDLHLRGASLPAATAKFDLMLSLTEHGDTLVGALEYATDLFDAATAGRLTGHFERLLAAAAARPGEPVFGLPLASDAERFQILVEWNDRGPAAEPRAFLHELFAAQARRTPEAVAVVCGDRELTYAGLGARAGRLARRLRAHGVGPDVPVGVLCERSLDMVAGVLGILQAGGACLPLDPHHPAQRLAFLLDDTRCPVLLTQAHLAGRLPACGAEVLLLDGAEDAGEGGFAAAAEEPAEELAETNLAYVIYTSGSTGRPKGVALPHGVLRNLLDWHLATLLGGVRTLQFALLTFDVSFYEMFACWGSGGTLVVVPEDLRRDMAGLADLLVEQRIQKAILPVVVLQQLAEIYAEVRDLPPLLEITTTGERLQTNRAMEALLRRLPGCAFHNQYGPSETHVATAFPLPADPRDWPADPPIGRPVWRCSTYVLAPGPVPVPVGVPGELYIGGVCLARGYLGRPGLTAERFVPDPLGGTPGARLYRTGDKVRLLPGGDLEYLGRFDDQVKIRGFRVELGEIEVLLLAQPGVREAAVAVREERTAGGTGIPRLTAYVAGDASVFTPGTLQAALREQLPDYMVPTAFVSLAALPLTANGKVDKRALPAPDRQRPEEDFLAPRTAVEEILAGIWAELLGLERVGLADHFFELGGHSLLAARAMSRLRSACGVEMPLRDLFEAPLLADLAVRIEAALRAGTGPAAPPLVPVPHQGPVPLSYPQERLWILYLLEPESSAFHLGSAVRLTGALSPGAFAASLGETVRRHEVLRTRYQEWGDEPAQIVDPAAPLPLPLIDLGGLPEGARERELRQLAEREMARPFDLTRDWPLRAHLVRLAREEHAALFTLHHIAGDGWSLGLLNREVGALYAAFAPGSAIPAGRVLPEPAVQYADFALWQRGWLSGERLEEQLAWWRDRLAGPLPVLELPQRRDRPDTPGFRGADCPLTVPASLRRSLEQIGHREGATLFMTLLAAFKALLHLYTGQEDLLVGTSVANRDRSEIEGLIGFFVNNLVLRTSLSGDPGFRALVRRVRDVALGAFVHQEVPFEKVLEAVHPRRQTAFAPLFQAMFVLDNFPVAAPRTGGLEITPLALEARTANFDLTLRLREVDGGLGGALQYDTDLFTEAAMARMAEHYLALLHSVTEDPDRPLSTIPLTGESEIRELASAFNEDF